LWGGQRVKILSACILSSLFIPFILTSSQAQGPDWKLYYRSDDILYLYDARSITKSKGILKVSEKSVFRRTKQYNYPQALTKIEKEGADKMSDELRKKTIDGLALQVTRCLYEIRCSPKRYRMITGMKYDNEGILIDSVIISLEWHNIEPGSIIERLYNEVCR
jgi:surface-adhesin protein E